VTQRECDDLIVLLDDAGARIGVAGKRASHHTDTPLHLAFSVYAFDRDGRLLLTRRSARKTTWPGVWTNTCCGHPAPGESLETAVRRRVRAELGVGVAVADVVLACGRYRVVMANGMTENEMGPVLRVLLDGPVAPNPAETDAVRWEPWEKLADAVLNGTIEISPWSEQTIRRMAVLGGAPWSWTVVDPVAAIPALAGIPLAQRRS